MSLGAKIHVQHLRLQSLPAAMAHWFFLVGFVEALDARGEARLLSGVELHRRHLALKKAEKDGMWMWSYWHEDTLVAMQAFWSPTEEGCRAALAEVIQAAEDEGSFRGGTEIIDGSVYYIGWTICGSDRGTLAIGTSPSYEAYAEARVLVKKALTWDSTIVDENGLSGAERLMHAANTADQDLEQPKVNWFGEEE